MGVAVGVRGGGVVPRRSCVEMLEQRIESHAPSLDTSPPPPAQWSCKYYHNLEGLHPLYFLQPVAKQDAAKDKPKGAASQNDKKTDKNADKNNENKEASLKKDLDELKKAIDGTCAFKRLHSAFLNCSILC